ncbi:hypothetical protein ACSQ67_003797 [Phaseolus vulgaris]
MAGIFSLGGRGNNNEEEIPPLPIPYTGITTRMTTFLLTTTTEEAVALSYGTNSSSNILWTRVLHNHDPSFTKIYTPPWVLVLDPAGLSPMISLHRDPASWWEEEAGVEAVGLAVKIVETKLKKIALTCGAEHAARAGASIAKPMSRAHGYRLHAVARDSNNSPRYNKTLKVLESFRKGRERGIIITPPPLLSPALACLPIPPPQVYTIYHYYYYSLRTTTLIQYIFFSSSSSSFTCLVLSHCYMDYHKHLTV